MLREGTYRETVRPTCPNVIIRAMEGELVMVSGADLITDCPLSIEVKDHARMELAAWLDQAVAQAEPGAPGVVFHHRRGKGNPADWYATMRVSDLLALVRRIR